MMSLCCLRESLKRCYSLILSPKNDEGKQKKQKNKKTFPCQSCVDGKLIKLELSFFKSIFGLILGKNFVTGAIT
jgi:hypothetical protein